MLVLVTTGLKNDLGGLVVITCPPRGVLAEVAFSAGGGAVFGLFARWS